MPMEANPAGVGIRPIDRPQVPGSGERIGPRSGSGTTEAFSPRTNLAIQTAVDDMAGVLSKISSAQAEVVEEMPKDLQQVVQNILKQAFAFDETLGQGLGSTLESQRFSMEQLGALSRMLTQMGALADKGVSANISEDMQALLANLKNLVTTEEGKVLEPVLLLKASFELLSDKSFDELPMELQRLLLTLQPQGQAMVVPSGESDAFGFLKQLVQFFMPRPSTAGQESAGQPQQGQQPGQADARQGQQPGGGQNTGQAAAQGTGARGQGFMSGTAQGNAQGASLGQTVPHGQPGQAQTMPQAQGGQNAQTAPQGQGQALPQSAGQSGQAGGNALAQGQSNIQGQTGLQGQQAMPGQTAPQGQAGQPLPQGQQALPGQQQAMPGQTAQQSQNGQPLSQGQQAMQGQPGFSGQQATPQSMLRNMQNQQTSFWGRPQAQAGQPTQPNAPQAAAMQQAKAQLMSQNMENTPQAMNAMKDLAQLLLKDAEMTQRDTQLLQNFVNGRSGTLDEQEAKQLQQLIRLCQQNVPTTVQQAALQQDIPDLPRLYAFMQLCDMTSTRNMTGRQLKKAGRDVVAFVMGMRSAMVGENSVVQGQRSLNFMMPMYLGENEQSYPAYIHVYDENQRDPETGEQKKETWLRLCVLTENIGAVELTCRVFEGNQLDMRIFFSDSDFANEFRENLQDIRRSFRGPEQKLHLNEFKVNASGERRFI